MKISYAITVCNEREEIERLLRVVLESKREQDEVIVLCDEEAGTDEVKSFLENGQLEHDYQVWYYPLNKDFSAFKNELNSHCTGDYIFQIDADEIPNPDLFALLPLVAVDNVDLIWVPRINTVDGLTEEHVKKWGWRINEDGWVNWPDLQCRIYRNHPDIKWEGRVHERVVGFKTYATLPAQSNWALRHPKTIDRQERQNDFYEGI